MRFWTSLQDPRFQAVLVEDGAMVRRIPLSAPKTIARRVGIVSEYNDSLAILRAGSFELWTRDGLQCETSFYSPKIHAPHGMMQWGDEVLVLSSGLELFFTMNIEGEISWEFWAHENGIGGKNPYYFSDEWEILHLTGLNYAAPAATAGYFNSMSKWGEKIVVGSLRKNTIFALEPGTQNVEVLHKTERNGLHSPIVTDLGIVFGLEKGIALYDGSTEHVFAEELSWVKYIRESGDGRYFATHETGLSTLNADFEEIARVALPRPFRFAFLEE